MLAHPVSSGCRSLMLSASFGGSFIRRGLSRSCCNVRNSRSFVSSSLSLSCSASIQRKGGTFAIMQQQQQTRNVSTYQAWQVSSEGEKQYVGKETELSIDDLPNKDNGTLIHVTHSSLNYKDALSASGNKGVTRNYPHTPGIDAAGYITDDKDEESKQPVIVTGYDLGMNTSGGYGTYIRIPSNWIAKMPSGWDAHTAMIYGTAGLTAGLCVQKLIDLGKANPSDGPVAVTGATGAVGSVAVEILSKLGFSVTAISGKSDKKPYLEKLGAKEVVGREVLEATKKPMVKPIFAHAIDTVGGTPLVTLLKHIQPSGSVSCCGLAAGPQLDMTVLPFILRGINLLGVDSVEISIEKKQLVWDKLATEWSCPITESTARTIGRHELDAYLKAFLKGESYGKIVLDHSLTTSNL